MAATAGRGGAAAAAEGAAAAAAAAEECEETGCSSPATPPPPPQIQPPPPSPAAAPENSAATSSSLRCLAQATRLLEFPRASSPRSNSNEKIVRYASTSASAAAPGPPFLSCSLLGYRRSFIWPERSPKQSSWDCASSSEKSALARKTRLANSCPDQFSRSPSSMKPSGTKSQRDRAEEEEAEEDEPGGPGDQMPAARRAKTCSWSFLRPRTTTTVSASASSASAFSRSGAQTRSLSFETDATKSSMPFLFSAGRLLVEGEDSAAAKRSGSRWRAKSTKDSGSSPGSSEGKGVAPFSTTNDCTFADSIMLSR